jgi:hypothetical protein
LRTGQTETHTRVAALGIEQLVLEIQHPVALGEEVPAAGQTHGVGARGPVERLGDRGPPVDDNGLLVAVRDGQTSDVEGFVSAISAVGP